MSDKVVTLKLGEKLAMPDEQIEVFEPKGPLEFKRTNTNDLMAATFPALKAIVPGYVYGGFVVLAGRQKLGKTWLAIDWAVAIATGGVALGSIDCAPGDVLYIKKMRPPPDGRPQVRRGRASGSVKAGQCVARRNSADGEISLAGQGLFPARHQSDPGPDSDRNSRGDRRR